MRKHKKKFGSFFFKCVSIIFFYNFTIARKPSPLEATSEKITYSQDKGSEAYYNCGYNSSGRVFIGFNHIRLVYFKDQNCYINPEYFDKPFECINQICNNLRTHPAFDKYNKASETNNQFFDYNAHSLIFIIPLSNLINTKLNTNYFYNKELEIFFMGPYSTEKKSSSFFANTSTYNFSILSILNSPGVYIHNLTKLQSFLLPIILSIEDNQNFMVKEKLQHLKTLTTDPNFNRKYKEAITVSDFKTFVFCEDGCVTKAEKTQILVVYISVLIQLVIFVITFTGMLFGDKKITLYLASFFAWEIMSILRLILIPLYYFESRKHRITGLLCFHLIGLFLCLEEIISLAILGVFYIPKKILFVKRIFFFLICSIPVVYFIESFLYPRNYPIVAYSKLTKKLLEYTSFIIRSILSFLYCLFFCIYLERSQRSITKGGREKLKMVFFLLFVVGVIGTFLIFLVNRINHIFFQDIFFNRQILWAFISISSQILVLANFEVFLSKLRRGS